MIPYTYLIFHLGQFQILGGANTCLFSKKLFGLSIPNIWQKEEFLSFPPEIIFAHICSQERVAQSIGKRH